MLSIGDLVFLYKESKELLQRINVGKSKFLDNDISFLIDSYQDENPIDQKIPYSELVDFTALNVNDIKIELADRDFELKSDCLEHKSFQIQAHGEFEKAGKINKDGNTVRLDGFQNNGQCVLRIQRAKYSDQVQSNLVMDWEGPHKFNDIGINILRGYMMAKFPKHLPPIEDKRMANTIGLSCILYFKDKNGNLTPYLPKRSKGITDDRKKLAIFEGVFHCTSSGAMEWKNSVMFSQFIDEMYREIEEEVGLHKSDIQSLVPLALCREFLRGGKPQIFFSGIINLSSDEIKKKRQNALKNLGKNEKIEIEDTNLLINSFDELKKAIAKNGLSTEAVANLYYSIKYLEKSGK